MCSCFPLFLLNIFAHFEQVLAEYSFQFKHVGPYLSKQFYFSLFSVFVHSRVSYATDKVLAQTGSKIKKGETVAPLQKLEMEHCLWMMTCGEGMGKFQWR